MIAKVQDAVKEAMKSGDKVRLAALRNLLAELKKEQIDSGKELDDAACIQIVKRGIKKLKESIEQFSAANRQDLVEKESAQLKILEEFAPKQLSPEETEKVVEEAIAETGAAGKQDMGKVMKAVMAKAGSQIDGKSVQQMVMSKLS